MLSMDALNFMWDGGLTRRYHTVATIQTDTVGHHSYNVACIVMALRPDASAALLRAALTHDQAEHITGDVPATTKRSIRGLRKAMDDFEQSVAALHGVDLGTTSLSPDEKRILKLADSLDGMRFCISERALGNTLISTVFSNFASYVYELLYEDEKPGCASSHESQLYHQLLSNWRSADERK